MDNPRSHACSPAPHFDAGGVIRRARRSNRSAASILAQRAEGPYLYDVDGNRYSISRLVGADDRGHNHPAVLDAVLRTARDGLSFGVPNPLEVTMAETIARLVPAANGGMVNSGTEATLSAIRLARGATGRARIVKFEGCYHGHGDSSCQGRSGALTFGVPTSPGGATALADLTLTLRSTISMRLPHYLTSAR